MSEEEFLNSRIPVFIDDNSKLVIPSRNYHNEKHTDIMDKFGYNWHTNIRGYIKPNEYIMLYIADYEIPNCTTWFVQYLFNKLPEIKWIGFGCIKGKIGEYWRPRMVVVRDNEEIYKLTPAYDLSNKPSEESVGE